MQKYQQNVKKTEHAYNIVGRGRNIRHFNARKNEK